MNKRMVLFFVMVMLFVPTLSCPCVSAKDYSALIQRENYNDNLYIDEDIALTIGIIFVANTINEYAWSESTQIDFIRPLYDCDDSISHYYIGLQTENNTSYVIVSTNMENFLITEFSDCGQLSVRHQSASADSTLIKDISEGSKIYYNSFLCSDIPIQNKKDVTKNIESDTAKTNKMMSENLVYIIRRDGISLRDRCGHGFLTDPII
jgi:hypothetical protein